MIFTGFKRKTNQIFFNKRIAELTENSTKTTSNKVKNIMVVIDDSSLKDAVVNELSQLFSISKDSIEILVVKSKRAKNEVVENSISPKDFGWYGKIKTEWLKEILTKKYDLLINYSKVENLYTNLLLLHCKVIFKVGFAHLDNRFYDLIIKCEPTEITLFNKELKKYLEILNKI
ncbi:DUF6913 domain-containing protein [Lutibacter aestuarii]|uniref:DUF6913 domain-containing protein n=1 Tax=Lutibacter aestuarii TaxID=861111 RepID=A0ABW2Z882_9FLAO